MKPFQVTAFLSILPSLISALPSAAAPSTSKFLLQTVAVDGSKYDGLTVFPAHTYAGGNVPGLFESSKGAIPAFLENGALYFHFPHSSGGNYAFGLTYTDYAAAWFECTISIGSKPIKHEFEVSKDGYLVSYEKNKIEEKGIERSIKKTFKGAYWRVCKWSHGYPELFLNNPENSNNEDPEYVPDNCSLVNLKVVPQ